MKLVGGIKVALTEGVVDRVRDAHARWESDCLALDQQLTDAGLTFGATGYKLAVERGAYRLVEGRNISVGLSARGSFAPPPGVGAST